MCKQERTWKGSRDSDYGGCKIQAENFGLYSLDEEAS